MHKNVYCAKISTFTVYYNRFDLYNRLDFSMQYLSVAFLYLYAKGLVTNYGEGGGLQNGRGGT